MRSTLASHLRLTMASWEPPLKMILIQLQEKLPRNSKSNILWSFSIWSKLERSQSSKVGVSWADQKSKQTKNKSSFWSVVFSYSMQQQWTISLSDCDMWQKVDFIPQQTITSSVVGLRRSFKALPKAKLAPKKMIVVTVWWSAACLIQYSFLNPSKTGAVCSANQWDALKTPTPAASVGQQKGPNSSLWQCWPHVITRNWVMKFCLICYIQLTSCQLITISSIISTTFCRENTSTTSRRQKMLSKSSSNPKP